MAVQMRDEERLYAARREKDWITPPRFVMQMMLPAKRPAKLAKRVTHGLAGRCVNEKSATFFELSRREFLPGSFPVTYANQTGIG